MSASFICIFLDSLFLVPPATATSLLALGSWLSTLGSVPTHHSPLTTHHCPLSLPLWLLALIGYASESWL